MEIPVETQPCVVCGKRHVVVVDSNGYRAWLGGKLIQKALPDLTRDQRELLNTGTCPECWDRVTKDDE